MGIEKTYPLEPSECLCIPTNKTQNNIFGTSADFIGENETSPRHYPCSFDATENGTDFSIDGLQSPGCHYAPNVFLSSVILFAGTFILSRYRNSFIVI